MTKNTLLNSAILVCKSLRIIYILFFIILTGFFTHYQINPSAYKNFDYKSISFKQDSNLNFKYESKYKHSYGENTANDDDVFQLNEITTSSLYFIYIKIIISLILGFLCLKEFQNIVESVKKIKTFQERNVSSFRKIGKYLLVIFILSSFSTITFRDGGITTLNISILLPCLIILAFIMAEIFKEGSMLSEENSLTV